jgi:hypothetical protein
MLRFGSAYRQAGRRCNPPIEGRSLSGGLGPVPTTAERTNKQTPLLFYAQHDAQGCRVSRETSARAFPFVVFLRGACAALQRCAAAPQRGRGPQYGSV